MPPDARQCRFGESATLDTMAVPGPPPKVIRDGIRDLVALLADAERQRVYERDVPIAHVPAELVCMWFDDLYHPDDPAFVRAFSTAELAALDEFNRIYRSVADELEPLPPSVADLHAHPAWSRVSPAAAAALMSIDGGGYPLTGPL